MTRAPRRGSPKAGELGTWVLALLLPFFIFLACAPQTEAPPKTQAAPPAIAPAPTQSATAHIAEVKLSQPQGPIESALFARVMGKRQSSFRACYTQARTRNPGLRAELRFEMSVSPTGRVATVNLASPSSGDAAFDDCLRRVIRHVQFPPFSAGRYARLEFPLRFAP